MFLYCFAGRTLHAAVVSWPQIMGQNAEVVDNSTRDSASLVLMNLVEMYPKPIGAKWSKAILETCFKLGLMYDVEEETEREALSTQQVHSLGTTPYNIAGITVDKCAEYFMSKCVHVLFVLLRACVLVCVFVSLLTHLILPVFGVCRHFAPPFWYVPFA